MLEVIQNYILHLHNIIKIRIHYRYMNNGATTAVNAQLNWYLFNNLFVHQLEKIQIKRGVYVYRYSYSYSPINFRKEKNRIIYHLIFLCCYALNIYKFFA